MADAEARADRHAASSGIAPSMMVDGDTPDAIRQADLVGPTGKVYAFEPNPNVATLLGYSLRANNFTSRAVVDCRVISDRAGTATFHIPAVALTNARIIDPGDPAQTGSSPDLTVETVALDDLLYDGIKCIKVISKALKRIMVRGQESARPLAGGAGSRGWLRVSLGDTRSTRFSFKATD